MASRCLIVKMQRKTASEKTERYSATKDYQEFDVLCRKAARWAQDNLAAIRDAAPETPDIDNRSLDNYEPLFKIAHVIGGEWPSLIREAAVKMLGADSPVELSRSIELLKDIKTIFDADSKTGTGECKIASAGLVKALVEKEDRPWGEYNRGKPISQNQMARLLKDFFIYSRHIRQGDKTMKGYFQGQFDGAFERYLPDQPETPTDRLDSDSQPKQRNSVNENEGLGQNPQPKHNVTVSVAGIELSVEDQRQCFGVSVENSETVSPDTISAVLPQALDRFREVWAADFEFHCPDGDNPKPHCVVALELRTGRTIRLLREDFPAEPPHGIGSDSLVLLYAGASDLRCHISAGWPLPGNYIDLCVESKLCFNSPGPDRGSPSLISVLDRFGIKHIDSTVKKKEQKRYNKPELSDDDRRDILPYCEVDVVVLPELFMRLLPDMNIDAALLRGEFVKQMAIVEARGIPIAVPEYEKIAANRKQIRLDLIAQSPVGPEVYEKGSFSFKKFGAWLERNEIDGWERTAKSGRHAMTEDYLDEVAAAVPAVRPLLDLVLSLKDFKKCPFGVGIDGRTHADQIPFGAISGRNTPSGFVLTAAKFWRWVVCAPKGSVLIYADFRNEEFACAAYLSGDPNMISGYELPDVYQCVADQLGVSRKNAKVAMLATQYGAGPRRLENSLGVPYVEAERIFRYHKQTYSRQMGQPL
jgi:DNA polymerase-1